MNCRDCKQHLVAYIQGRLPQADVERIAAHLAGCGACSVRLAEEKAILDGLAEYRIPDPSPDFERRVLNAAMAGNGGSGGRSWSTPILGGAIAAALALGISLGVGMNRGVGPDGDASQIAGDARQDSAAQEALVVVDQVQTVRLAFSSGEALEDVTLTLELPVNVELASFPGHHRLSWKVDLRAGDNVLALPLRVLFPGDGELVAHIDDGQRQKTFRASIPGATAVGTTEPSS